MSFKPMKACDWDETKVKFPLIAQPKIDGVRGLIPKDFIVARTLRQFDNRYLSSDSKYNCPQLSGLDCELTLGNDITRSDLCRTTSSATSTYEGEPDIFLQAFDVCALAMKDVPYYARLETLQGYVRSLHKSGITYVNVVESHVCECLDDFLELEEGWLANGMEGGMLKHPDGRYKHGRSTVREQYSMRVKRFVDKEAIIIGFEEAEENLNEATVDALGYTKRSSHQANKVGKNMVGNVWMRDETGFEFPAGPGNLTHSEREIMWATRDSFIGKIGKFKHFPKGRKVGYRFATFISVRDPKDLG